MVPWFTTVHHRIVEREVALSPDLRVEQEDEVDAVPTIVDVGFESRKDGEDLLAEGNAVFVLFFVPRMDDGPDRAGLGGVRRSWGVWRETDDLDAVGNGGLKETPCIALENIGCADGTGQAVGEFLAPPGWSSMVCTCRSVLNQRAPGISCCQLSARSRLKLTFASHPGNSAWHPVQAERCARPREGLIDGRCCQAPRSSIRCAW